MEKIMNEKINVVSFSGGRTSAYLCKLIKEKYPDNSVFIFIDTGAEHPATYDFVKKCNRELDLNLICIKAKINHEYLKSPDYKIVPIDKIGWNLDVWVEMGKKYSTPYSPKGEFCTKNLKTYPFYKYCKDKFGNNYIKWLGIRADEPSRLKNRELKEYKNVRYLADISNFDKLDINNFWKNNSFDLNIENTDIIGNCVFCLKRGNQKLALAIRQEPKLAEKWQQDYLENKNILVKKNKDGITRDPRLIYRGGLDLNGIANLFAEYSDEELYRRLKKTKNSGRGCGSGSCEISQSQIDLF